MCIRDRIDTVVCCDRPVVMLSGAVHACKRLLMKQALEAVSACHHLQSLHDNLVVVYGHIGLCVDGSQLVLRRSHLIVLGPVSYTHLA